ncbi:MAG: EVE domain-containing protein [Terriglobia bacterium]
MSVQKARGRRCWLFTSDPTRYHWDTLFVKGKELWNGIKSDAGQRYLRQAHRGDLVVCYHGPPSRSVYATAFVASEPYPDPHAHPKGKRKRFLVVDLKAGHLLPRIVPFKELKGNRALRRMRFLKRSRLAVSPLSEEEYNEILRVAGVHLGPLFP